MWLSLLQAWVYQHFQGMGSKDVWSRYQEHHPHTMLFILLHGLGTTYNYRNLLDRLYLTGVVMAPYGEHRQARAFEWVSLFTGWLRYGDHQVRYMPERVLRQFGRVQTKPRHPVQVASPETNLGEISLRFHHALDNTLTDKQLGERVVHGMEVADGYIEWSYLHSHPHMFLQENGDVVYVQVSARLSHIRGHVYVVMSNDLVLRGSEAWEHLEEVWREVHDGKVYRRRGANEGSKGARGGGVGGGVIIRD